ncbi:MAG: DNA methyltransferase [Armatimonadetes bacterium]|nr:DNA methyltransferase [Armatimonadota bacterium]
MVSKSDIETENSATHNDFFRETLRPSTDASALLRVLDGLGRLPADFDAAVLLPLIHHCNDKVRLSVAKNMGKTKDLRALHLLCELVFTEKNTLVRREMVSAIGRARNPEALSTLYKLLEDEDAKVVLQAIRGLLCFKRDPAVIQCLSTLKEHPNELIRSVLQKELQPKRSEKGREATEVGSPDWLKNVLVNADVFEALKSVPDDSVHLTFTSPPYYNARDYTIYKSYDDYLAFLVKVFAEVHRITKEGRFFVLNTSPVLIPRMGRNHSSTRYLIPFDIHPLITKIGFDFIDDIVWVKPEPSAKNRNGGFFQHRKPLGYKANSVCEYVLVYRKKTDKLLDWNIRQYAEETIEASKVKGEYPKSNAWKIAPASSAVHSAIFPKELASRVIEFYSYKGDLVFDPFAGSGTVGQTALSLERHYLLTEQDPQYAAHAHKTLHAGSLYCEHPPTMFSLEQFAERAKSERAL